MKYLIIALLALTGCHHERLSVRHNDDRLELVEARLDALEAKDALILAQLDVLQDGVDEFYLFQNFQNIQNGFVLSELQRLDDLIDDTSQDVSNLVTQYNTLTQSIAAMSLSVQGQFTTLQNQVAALQASLSASMVTPIQLCPGDTAQYPEQGLRIGTSIYAVYYGSFSGSMQSFLAKLAPGNYVTTNGTACYFSVNADGSTASNMPTPSIPTQATHELLLCGITSYKVHQGVIVQGVTYSSNFTLALSGGSCSVNNPGSNSVSSNGPSSLGSAQSCNYNGIASVTSTSPVYNTSASSSSCYIKKVN